MKLFVTTGATITFSSLLMEVIKLEFLEHLISVGIEQLTVQYGNEVPKSEQLITRLMEDNEITSKLGLVLDEETNEHSKYDNSRRYRSKQHNFALVLFPFSTNISKYIREADLIISHAGTGSIIDTLRLRKKLVVVINTDLMDNHQKEIADEFTRANHCLSFNVEELGQPVFVNKLDLLLNNKIQLDFLPEPQGNIIESILYQELAR